VEMLGRFPDPAAADVLSDLLLHGERDIAAPAGRWLRDTALLTLVRPNRLPAAAVNHALGRSYSILRHPFPWQWSTVYDDLPLLSYYHRMGVFFRAFWLWPLLVLLGPTLLFLWPIAAGITVQDIGSLLPLSGLAKLLVMLVLAVVAIVGASLEIYLVHQVLVALLAGSYGPLLRLPGRVAGRRLAALGLVGLLVGLLVLFAVLFVNAPVATTSGTGLDPRVLGIELVTMVLPLVLLPMFIVAHDLEREVRYLPRGQEVDLRLAALALRRLTDLAYLILLPALALTLWFRATASQGATDNSIKYWLPLWLLYLFAVPVLVAAGLQLLTRLLAHTHAEQRDGTRPAQK
jgi:hypothetical protein